MEINPALKKIGFFDAEHYLIERHFPKPPARVLDIGFGYGRELLPLDEMGYDIDAIEVIPETIEYIKQYPLRARIHQMSATDLHFPDGSFEAVIFPYNGLDYIVPEASRDQAIREIYRVLKPGGIFILSSHNWIPFLLHPNIGRIRALLSRLIHWSMPKHYLRWKNEEGMLTLYVASPKTQIAHFNEMGFDLLEIHGKGSSDLAWVSRHVAWPYFALSKRKNA